MPRLIAITVVAMLAACGDNKIPSPTPPPDDAPMVTEDAPSSSGPCLDRPTDLPRPSTTLPCDLLPPGLQQKPKVGR